MNFFANENVPLALILQLRASHQNVTWARTEMPGATDDVILQTSVEQRRVLLTFDKDFGELVFHRGFNASCGVVLIRMDQSNLEALVNQVTATLLSRTDWEGAFSVLEDDRIRMISLPRRDSPNKRQ